MIKEKVFTQIIMALVALVFALMAILALQLGDTFIARLLGFLGLLCFGASGFEIIKKFLKKDTD